MINNDMVIDKRKIEDNNEMVPFTQGIINIYMYIYLIDLILRSNEYKVYDISMYIICLYKSVP